VKREAAHLIGREHDRYIDPEQPSMGRYVDPAHIVPLCRTCHEWYDARKLDLLPYITLEESAAAVQLVGIVAAYRRLTSSRDLPMT
jgi:hypothetical protein